MCWVTYSLWPFIAFCAVIAFTVSAFPDNMPVWAFGGLTHYIGVQAYKQHVAVVGLSLEVHLGEVLGLLGHNGAGGYGGMA